MWKLMPACINAIRLCTQANIQKVRVLTPEGTVLNLKLSTRAIKTGVIVLEALQRVNLELGTTTAVITHNAGIAQMADRVIHLADGRISQVDTNETRLDPGQLSW